MQQIHFDWDMRLEKTWVTGGGYWRNLLRYARALGSPKGWADARVGIGIGWGGGIPFIENKTKLQMFEFISLKITKFPIHVFLEILIPYSRFPRIDRTDLKDCSARGFSENCQFLWFPRFRDFPKSHVFKLVEIFFL